MGEHGPARPSEDDGRSSVRLPVRRRSIDSHLGGLKMQGTIVMLMALSGLGCHHKRCDVAPVATCYSSCYGACYGSAAPMSYTTYVAPSCYSACYSLCYSGSYTQSSGCYGGGYGGGCFHSRYRGGDGGGGVAG